MAFVPTAARRRTGAARIPTETLSKAAAYGAFAFAFTFTCALVLGVIP